MEENTSIDINKEKLILQEKITAIFTNDRNRLLSFIKQRIRIQEEAEDILQDVFANMISAAKLIEKPIDNVPSWVFTAIRNRIIDSYRKKRAETFSDLQKSNAFDDDNYYENTVQDGSQNPEDDLLRKTIWEAVQEGLKQLPEEQREAFEKNEFEGKSFKDMADELGVNINTLLARKRYAVLHLRKQLKDLYESFK